MIVVADKRLVDGEAVVDGLVRNGHIGTFGNGLVADKNGKRRTVLAGRRQLDRPGRSLDDLAADEQAQSSTGFLGREVRLENLIVVFLANPVAGVLKSDADATGVQTGRNFDRAPFGRGIHRVQNQVENG